MNKNTKKEVFKLCNLLNFDVSVASPGRTWIKAGTIYLWTYIIPILDNDVDVPKNNILLNIIENLLKYFKSVCLNNKTNDKILQLPTNKVFLSFQRLEKRLTGFSYSRKDILDFEEGIKCSFQYNSFNCKTKKYLLIGLLEFISIDSKSFLTLTDKSGTLYCSYCSDLNSFIGQIVLITTWNFIPCCLNDFGFIELTERPLIVFNKSTTNQLIYKNNDSFTDIELNNILDLFKNPASERTILFPHKNIVISYLVKIISHKFLVFKLSNEITLFCSSVSKEYFRSLALREGCIVLVHVNEILTSLDSLKGKYITSLSLPKVLKHSHKLTKWKPFHEIKSIFETKLKDLSCEHKANIFKVASNFLTSSSENDKLQYFDSIDDIFSSKLFKKFCCILVNSDLNKKLTENHVSYLKDFKSYTIKRIKENAIQMSKSIISSGTSHPDYWSYCIIEANNLLKMSEKSTQEVLLLGSLVCSLVSGLCCLSDCTSELPIVFVDETNSNSLTVSSKAIGSFLIIKNFQIVVERKWITVKDEYNYSVYILLHLSNFILLNSNKLELKEKVYYSFDLFNMMTEESTLSSENILNKESMLSSHVSSASILKDNFVVLVLTMFVKDDKMNNGFTVFCLKMPTQNGCTNVKFSEYTLHFMSDTAKYQSLFLPGAVVSLTNTLSIISNDNNKSYKIKSCMVQHLNCLSQFCEILNYTDSFAIKVLKNLNYKWNKSEWNILNKPVLCTNKFKTVSGDCLRVVNILGTILKRSTFQEGIYNSTKTRIDISADDKNCNECVSIYFECSLNSYNRCLGLIPGCKVIFYHLKKCISRNGNIYLKYIKNSLFKVIKTPIKTRATEYKSSIAKNTKMNGSIKNKDIEPIEYPECNIGDLYFDNEVENYSNFVILASLVKILDVEIRIEESFLAFSNATLNKQSNYLHFKANCVLDDGSGQALVSFDESNINYFCLISHISSQEWNRALLLLNSVEEKTFCFTFLNTLPEFESKDKLSKTALHLLFKDINSKCLEPKKVVVSYNFKKYKPDSKTEFLNDFHLENPMCTIKPIHFNEENMPLYGLNLNKVNLSCIKVF